MNRLFLALILLFIPLQLFGQTFASTYGAPELVSVVSRQIQGSATTPGGPQTIDLPLSLTGLPTVEGRTGGAAGNFTFVATFNRALTAAQVTLNAATGAAVASQTISGDTITISLSGVTDNEIVELLLTRVVSGPKSKQGSGGFKVRMLHGDVNGDGAINGLDAAEIQANEGDSLTVDNAACDVDGDGQITSADYSADEVLAAQVTPASLLSGEQEAARFLTQASFGPTPAEINRVMTLGEAGWIEYEAQQAPMSLDALVHAGATQANRGIYTNVPPYPEYAWWQSVMQGNDALRERVAFALSEIFVISDANGEVNLYSAGAASYYDMLTADAFGNFRQLLQDVTMHPMMGFYLSYLYNTKANPKTGTHPDENYAREAMQLFSIGLNQLNPDGTLQLDGKGQPIPTYGNTEITNFARAFTGFTPAHPGTSLYGTPLDFEQPMALVDTYHDMGAKTFLTYPGSTTTNQPANQSSVADVNAALDNIFNHPNVGPFICTQLIQRLVTSNPTPGYVSRIAAIFNNDGTGVRGNLLAVVQAILLDDEARNVNWFSNPGHGKMREPWVRTVQLARCFNAQPTYAGALPWQVYGLSPILGMEPFRSPSVFNFFSPYYQPPGPVLDAGLVGPEFQISTADTIPRTINYFRNIADKNLKLNGVGIPLNLSPQIALAGNPLALINSIDLLLTGGMLSAGTRASALNAVNQISPALPAVRAQTALAILCTSPDYTIEN